MDIERLDIRIIRFCRKISVPLARLGLFTVFYWFGLLKIVGSSPASPLVQKLFEHTISFMTFETFIVLFGIFECVIGLLFLIRNMERVVIPFLFIHMITTFMPLFVIPEATWAGFMIPTLEGQYIIKNLLIVAAAITVAAHLHPLKEKNH